MEHPYEHLVGERCFAHGKFAYRWRLREVIGLHMIVDECEQLFRADAHEVKTDGDAKPVWMGDGIVMHSDWFEYVMPEKNCDWAKGYTPKRSRGER